MWDVNGRTGVPGSRVPAFSLISPNTTGRRAGSKRRPVTVGVRDSNSSFYNFRIVVILILTNVFLMIVLLQKSSLSVHQNDDMSIEFVDSDQSENLAVKGFFHKRRVISGIGVQSFIYMSGYRVGPATFSALGLAAAAFHMHRKAGHCRWQDLNGGVINGTINLRYPGDSHGRRYDAIILFCSLTSDADSLAGGKLTVQIDGSDVTVLSENPSNSSTNHTHPPFRSKLTLCSSPLHSGIDSTLVYQWLEFIRIIHGADYFVLYDAGGVTDRLLPLLDHYLSADRIEIVDVRQISKHDSWAHAQVLLGNDCLYRTKFTSEWVLLLDVDEYLTIPGQGGSGKLLNYASRQKRIPWMSFGSVVHSIHHCQQAVQSSGASWMVEKLIFREGEPYCRNRIRFTDKNMCLDWSGNRKFVFKPSSVNAITINRVVDPSVGGLDLSFSDVRVNRFVGLSVVNQSFCSFIWNPGTYPPRLVKDEIVAVIASRARRLQGIWQPM